MTSLEVIGAGLGRTGTKSLKEALEILGHEPCHHMYVALQQQNDRVHLWKNVAEDDEVEESLKKLYEGFKATTDYPGCVFFEEFMRLSPDAKVILTVRDDPGSWVTSVRNTIFANGRWPSFILWMVSLVPINSLYYLQYIQRASRKKQSGVDPLCPNTDLAKFYEDWNRHVTETVPKDKLLIFNVKQGWEPLCEFLGVPVPDKPFPSVNDSKDFQRNNSFKAEMRGTVLKVLAIGALAVAVWFSYRMSTQGPYII